MDATKAQHTPGPWVLRFDEEAREKRKSGVEFEIEKDGFLIQGTAAARDENAEGYFSNDVARANARLIAAAPDLLAALKNLTGACGCVRPLSNDVSCEKVTDVRRAMKFMDAVENARAAIAKAEGK